MMLRCLPALLAGVLLPGTLSAQFIPLTVPRGYVGVELHSGLSSWDQRYRNGTLEPAGADFNQPIIGASTLPSLAAADLRLSRLTGLTGSILNAGRYGVSQLTTVGDLGLGLQIGITSRLTLTGLVPLRRVQVQTVATYDSTDANSGLNPADPALGTAAGLSSTLAFFLEFDAAITALQAGITAGTWSGDPNTQALATATLADAQAVRGDLYDLLVTSETHSAFVPLANSPAGAAVLARIGDLQSRIGTGLGIGGFSRQPALPTAVPTTADWNRFLTDGAGPVAGNLSAPPVMALGDIEMGMSYLLISRSEGRPGGLMVRSAIQGTVRLRTSQLADPNRFFDLGTGDRQPDGEVALVTDLARGRGALRLAGWYTRQLPGNQQRRIGPPDQPIRYLATLAAVRKDPGDIVGVGVFPAYRFTSALAFLAGAEWWHRGTDAYVYADGQEPLEGLDPQILAEGTGASAVTIRAGLTLSNLGSRAPGRSSTPLDASVTWERVVAASGGRVPRQEAVRAMLRIYSRFW